MPHLRDYRGTVMVLKGVTGWQSEQPKRSGKETCPVSEAWAATEINLRARLTSPQAV
jgi:hypothetical protein